MLSVQGVTVPQGKETCSLSIVRPLTRSFHARKSTAPAWSMPVEVAAEIFGLASHSSHDTISQSISLSHVCRQWRQIALSLPSLWTSLHLSLPLSRSQLARTYAWIIRSRHCPLDIYMDFRDPSWDWDEESHVFDCRTMDIIMRFLAPHAPRWRSIELLADTWAPIFTFLSCTTTIDSAPRLRSIRLARCNEYFVAEGQSFRPANLALPIAWFGGGASLTHLCHVSLSGVHIDWTQSGLRGLQELELRYHARNVMPTVSEFRRILSANATLERLVILGWGPRMEHTSVDERDDDLHAIELPRLKELELGFVDAAYAVDLLSAFTLPKLRVLSIEDVAFGIQLCQRQDCSQLFDCLVGMSATEHVPPRMPLSCLCELSLRSVYVDDTSIHGLFNSLRAMTSLCLDRVELASLSTICSDISVCDQLRALTLKNIDPEAVLVLSSHSFPPQLRVFLDIDDGVDQDEEVEDDLDCRDIGHVTAFF